ncbi:MAG TPA: FAD-dependent oxidoreductase [Candidatus Acidoferrales bacterium]|nr:FAD-dependent oxidoreductase [Candidatus Acidoferrales bacterium]
MSRHAKPLALSRRAFLSTTSLAVTALLAGRGFAAGTAGRRKVDMCIYGGTSGGVIAAAALARLGRSVVLIEPTRHMGGMTSGGLGWIDFGRASTIGGLTKQYFDDIRAHYAAEKISTNGWSVEPHVAEALFERLIAEHKIEVIREARLAGVEKNGRRIRSLTLDKAPVDPRGAPSPVPLEKNFLVVEAAMFMDCSYEGDLLAAAGVRFRTDREGRDEFGEAYAGVSYSGLATEQAMAAKAAEIPLKVDPYVRPGDAASGLLPYVSASNLAPVGGKDAAVQAYIFRLCLTKNDPLPIAPPADYHPQNYELVRRYLTALDAVHEPLLPGDLYFNDGHKLPYPHPRLLKITRLMHGKTDVNSGSCGLSLDFVNGGAERYANGTWAERAKIWHAHEDYQRGYLYYLRMEERLPEWLRQEISPWGLPKDEFRDTGGWPTQLYIRQARRMVGSFVIDQNFCEHPSAREDSVGCGSYSLDSHICQRLVKDGAVIHEGGFYHRLDHPYPIPYAAIVPREEECENLLVTFCVSTTHVAFASVRMEPPFMILSESAALAADQALQEGTSVQRVSQAKLRQRLLAAGQVL